MSLIKFELAVYFYKKYKRLGLSHENMAIICSSNETANKWLKILDQLD